MRLLVLIISLLFLLFLPALQTGPSETFSIPFEDQPTTVPPPSPTIMPPLSPSSTMPPPSPSSTVPPPSPSTVPSPSSVPSSDPIIDNDLTDDEVEDEPGSEGDTNEDIKVDSDVYQKYINITTSKRHFKRSQMRSTSTTLDQINVDENGPDIGNDETNIGIRESLVGKLGGDEPYYLSDEAPSFEIDDETGWGDSEEVDQVVHKPVRRKKTPNRVVFDATYEKIVWELGLIFGSGSDKICNPRIYELEKYVNEHDRVRMKCCKETCPWLLYASTDKTSGDFIVKRYNHILLENIEKSMQYNLTWNGEKGFEIKHCEFTHTVDIVSRSCSCRSWQLRGIPCPHGVAAFHYKELEPINYVASCYSKETYLNTYAHFIQPMYNMKIWPTSNNPIVKPSKIKKMPGRPSKVRRNEANESRKTGKLSKIGVVMTCSKCGTQGYNKRGCPTRNQVGPSQSTEPYSQARGTGPSQSAELFSQTHVLLFVTFKCRCRGARTSRGRGRGAGTSRGRGMPQERSVNEGLGRGREMAQHNQTSSEATCSGRGLERRKRPVEHENTSERQTRPFKRPREVGVSIHQVENEFTTLNPGLPSRRVINTSIRVTKRADVVTGDIGYTPVRGFKWKGKTTITSRNLERMRAKKVIQIRSAVVATANSKAKQVQVRRLLCHESRAF
ncbi:hypothetical protein H5410_042643 [Solanum commersonii]|uniref:SWIM-type domain-containing protein n=1 Tax=Solanum commersonii TaxID=4109 RepID=A0A9J5XVB2_SOLCO|nr:hypothetical protein H5410_042643 [Solanum commersonii]